MTEVALICQARQGDRPALQQLLLKHWTWLKGLAYNILGNAEDVDECLQSICLLVIENIGELREPERFKAWLTSVARNAALAYRRQRAQRPRQLDEAAAERHHDPHVPDSLEKLHLREQQEQLLRAIHGLPEKYREVFILKHLQDASYGEIAEMLDIAVTTVQIRLVRARRMLANSLKGVPNQKIPRT